MLWAWEVTNTETRHPKICYMEMEATILDLREILEKAVKFEVNAKGIE